MAIAAYRHSSENRTEMILEAAIESFKQFIRKLKFTNTVKNRFAYFYGIVYKIIGNRYKEAVKEEFWSSDEARNTQSNHYPLLDNYDETNELESDFLWSRVLRRRALVG